MLQLVDRYIAQVNKINAFLCKILYEQYHLLQTSKKTRKYYKYTKNYVITICYFYGKKYI